MLRGCLGLHCLHNVCCTAGKMAEDSMIRSELRADVDAKAARQLLSMSSDEEDSAGVMLRLSETIDHADVRVDVEEVGGGLDPRGPNIGRRRRRSIRMSSTPLTSSTESSTREEEESRNGGGFGETERLVITNDKFKSWVPLSALALICVVIGLAVVFSLPSEEAWVVRYTIGIVMLSNAFVMVLNAKSEQYVFDSKSGKFSITSQRIVGTKETHYWLYEIRDVQVHEYYDPQGGTDYELYVYIRSGNRVKLFGGHIIGVGWEVKMQYVEAAERLTRENIKAFLNAFSKKFRARSKASHSSYRHYLKRKHFTSASLSQLPPSPYRPPFNA